MACTALLKTQGSGAACGPWTLEGTGLPFWEQDWAPWGQQGAGVWGSSPAWGLSGCGRCKDEDRDTNHPGRAGPDEEGHILHTYINTVQTGGAGEEGALLLSGGSRAGRVRGVLREPHTGLPGREVGWFPLVMEGMVGILHASRRGGGVRCVWGRRPPAPVRGCWQGVPILPSGTSGRKGCTPPPHITCMSQICVGLSSAISQTMAWSRS